MCVHSRSSDDSHIYVNHCMACRFKLKNREFTFDVDASQLPCGLNGALYFVEMDEDGGTSKYPGNTAGANYGTGYRIRSLWPSCAAIRTLGCTPAPTHSNALMRS